MVDAWVKWAAEVERHWNEIFNQIMGTEAFAQMVARSTGNYATAQAAFARGMEQYLHAMNMPTRTDLARLEERVMALEQRIDALTSQNPADGAAEPPAEKRRSGGGLRRPKA
jgi:polyhydroxyalkanoate synthesis regulator phasin